MRYTRFPSMYYTTTDSTERVMASMENEILPTYISGNSTYMEYVEPEPQGPVKHSCPWCHGVTFDDDVGHCVGCGGPRSA